MKEAAIFSLVMKITKHISNIQSDFTDLEGKNAS